MSDVVLLNLVKSLLEKWDFKAALALAAAPKLNLTDKNKRRLQTLIYKDEKEKLDALWLSLNDGHTLSEIAPEIELFYRAFFTTSQEKTVARIAEIKEHLETGYAIAIETLQNARNFKEAAELLNEHRNRLSTKYIEYLSTVESRILERLEKALKIFTPDDEDTGFDEVITPRDLQWLATFDPRGMTVSDENIARLTAITRNLVKHKSERREIEENTKTPSAAQPWSWSASLWSVFGLESTPTLPATTPKPGSDTK